jgi:xanthine dehydrogenase accessory factor
MPTKLSHSATAMLGTFFERLALEPAVLVQVASSQGSVPRGAGTWMAVFKYCLVGTVGGGHLEYVAIADARHFLANRATAVLKPTRRFALGPALGQCCGGVMHLQFELVTATDADVLALRLTPKLAPVALFGGGHVGKALANVLATLPVALQWIDSRDGVFPDESPQGKKHPIGGQGVTQSERAWGPNFPAGPPQGEMSPPGGQRVTRSERAWGSNVTFEHSDPPQMAVRDIAPQSLVLIMSFSHAEDLDIVATCLLRQRERGDLPFIGLIGSKTKWATFTHRLAARGFTRAELAHVTCPIGVAGITRKEPEVIAVAVAAQLLQVLQVIDRL